MKHVSLRWLVCFSTAFFLSSCSHVVEALLSPADNGAFVISGERQGDGTVKITWSGSDTLTGSLPNYQILYGYYLYCSPTSPYSDYALIARYYNTNASRVFTNVVYQQLAGGGVSNVETMVDFRVTNVPGGPSNVIYTQNAIPHSPLPGISYLRLVRYRLSRSLTSHDFTNSSGSNESYTDTSYSVSGHAASSYLAVTN